MKYNKISFKSIILIIFAVVIIIGIMTMGIRKSNTYAADETYTDSGVTYTLSKTTLKITGSGKATDVWKNKLGSLQTTSITAVTISKGITSIENSAFEGCTALKKVTFSASSTCSYIGNKAFKGCTSLENIVNDSISNSLPKSIITIGDEAFYNCSSLTKLNLNTGVTTLQENTFKGTTPLTELTIKSNIKNHNNAFKGHTRITTLKFVGKECTTIYDSMFEGCTGLTSVNQKTTVTNSDGSTSSRYYIVSIGNRAFFGCTGLNKKGAIIYSTNKELKVGKDAYRLGGYPGDSQGAPKVNISQSVQKANSETYYTDGIGKVTMNISAGDDVTVNTGKDYIVCFDTTGSMKKPIKENKDLTRMNISVEAMLMLAKKIYEENPKNRLAIVTQDCSSYVYMHFMDGENGNAEKVYDLIKTLKVSSHGNEEYGDKTAWYSQERIQNGPATCYTTALKTMADVIMARRTQRDRNAYAIFISDGFPNVGTGSIPGAAAQLQGFCDAVWAIGTALDIDEMGEAEFPPDDDGEDGVWEEISKDDPAYYLKLIRTYWGSRSLFYNFPDDGTLSTNFKAFMESIVDVSTSRLSDVTFTSVLNTDLWEFYSGPVYKNSDGLSVSGANATVKMDIVGGKNQQYSYYIRLKDNKRDNTDPKLLVSNNLSANYTITGGAYNGKNDTARYTERLTLPWLGYKAKVQAIKVDSETGNRISGAEFTIYEWNKEKGVYEEYSLDRTFDPQLDEAYFTDNTLHLQADRSYLSGWLYKSEKNEGKFKIVETKAPDGYYGDFNNGIKRENDITVTRSVNGQTLIIQNEEGEYKNTRVKGTINVNKIDRETNRYLAQGDGTLDGAEYGLYAAEEIIHKDTVIGKIYSKDQLVQTQIIENGVLTFEEVEIGEYYIKEITPPEGYLKDETRYDINMNYEGETVAHLTRDITVIEQIKKQGFILKKVSSDNTSTELPPLANAGFKIFLIKDLEGVKNGTLKPSNGKQYTVNDFMKYDFSREQTALDYSNTSEGERIGEIFSDAEGNLTSPELAYGRYVVIETTVPEDRVAIDPFIVTIKEDSRIPQSQRVVIDNEFEALIRVIKKDRQTGATVLNKNAKYRIWNKTENKYVEQSFIYPIKITYGTEENPYEINEQGEFITPLKLQLGEYELREIKAPEGYILSGHEGKLEQGEYKDVAIKAVEFSVKSNTIHYEDPEIEEIIIDVEQYNDEALGELEVNKIGECLTGTRTRADGTIEPIYEEMGVAGAEFEVYAKEDIYSQDNQGTKLCEKDQLVKKIETNERGKAYLDNIPIGKYYVKEVKAPEGFLLSEDKEIKEFEITYKGEETPTQKVEMTYKNKRQKINLNGVEGLKVEKIADKTIYKPGEIITYKIKVSNSSEYTIKDIKVEETMIKGKFEDIKTDNITKIGDKTVEIKELKPGEKVELKFIVTINEDEKITEALKQEKVKVTNKIEAKGKIEKPGSGPEDIKGVAEEEIYITNKKLIIIKEALKEEYQIGETAQYVIKVINNGTEDITKVLIEEKLLNGEFVYLEESNKNGVEIVGEGQRVVINKIEPGETIILRYEYKITEATKVTLDENQEMLLPNTVKVKGKIEKPSPENPNETITEEVEEESTEQIKIIEKDHKYLGIIKRDSETGETIQGATIGIYAGEDLKDKQGKVIIAKDTLIEKVVTNEEGKAKYSVDLPLGKYYIKEVEAPLGYRLSEETIEIDGGYQGPEIEEISVSKILGNISVSAKIQKTNEDGKLISGAELEVVDEKGNIIDSWKTTEEFHILKKLEIGKIYILREKVPAKGYVTAEEIKFTINQEEKVYCIQQEADEGITVRDLKEVDSIKMVDEKTKVTIEVVDKETKAPISGIIVEIKDKETGEIIYKYETDGKPKTIIGIPIGECEVITKDPENRGYVTTTTEIKVEDTSQEQKVIVEQEYTRIEINLREEKTKELIKEGAFDIIDEKGKVVQIVKTKEGVIKLDRLPVGIYTIHQTEVPNGYYGSKDVKIEIRDTGELQIFEVLNKKKIVNFSVEKTLSSIMLNGKNIEVTNNKLAKLEIKTADVRKTKLIAAYNIKVTNNGDIPGKVTVLENLPEGYEILEAPGYWTTRTDGKLQTEVQLEAGQSKDLSVTLKWKNKEINLGSRSNKVQIEGEQQEDNLEDNISEATIVVSIKTGEVVSIIIIGMIIIALIIAGYITYRVIQRKGPGINGIRFLK